MRKIHFSLSLAIIASCAMGACTLKELDDTIYLCGDSQKNCTTRDPYWLNGECVNGDCIATECKVGAYPYQGKCIQDTVEACGSPNNNCYENNQKCSLGKCVDACPNSETDCSDACKDLTKDPENCGSCGNICEKDDHGETTCQNSKCQLKCNDGYKKAYNSALDKLTCQKIEDSIVQQPACIEKGTCTCTSESGPCECVTGYIGDDCNECDREKGYIFKEGGCVQDPTQEPSTDLCDLNPCTEKPNAESSCHDGECSYTCKEGYQPRDDDDPNSDCIQADGQCVHDSDCPEKPNQSATCSDAGFCLYLDLTTSICTKAIDCSPVENAIATCESGECTYACVNNYHINIVNTECVPDSPTECGDIRENCVDSCLKGLKDSSKAIGICNSGLCQCGQCDEGSIANADHTKCEKDISTPTCSAKKCVTANAGWKKAVCEDDQCKAIECETGYHIYNDQKKGSKDICELDTVERCGDPYVDCETTVEGWEIGNCSNGICTVTHCKPGYSVKNNKCIYRCPENHIYCPTKNKCCNTAADCNNSSAKCLLPLGELEVVNLCKEGQTNCTEDPKYCCDDPADCNSESTRQTKCASILTVPED